MKASINSTLLLVGLALVRPAFSDVPEDSVGWWRLGPALREQLTRHETDIAELQVQVPQAGFHVLDSDLPPKQVGRFVNLSSQDEWAAVLIQATTAAGTVSLAQSVGAGGFRGPRGQVYFFADDCAGAPFLRVSYANGFSDGYVPLGDDTQSVLLAPFSQNPQSEALLYVRVGQVEIHGTPLSQLWMAGAADTSPTCRPHDGESLDLAEAEFVGDLHMDWPPPYRLAVPVPAE